MFCLLAGKNDHKPTENPVLLSLYELVMPDFMLEHKYAHIKCQTRPGLFQRPEWDSHGLKYLHNDC